MEHPKLKDSPIVEAVCEFRFAPEAEWDWTVPGRLAPALQAKYPVTKEVSPQIVTFGSAPDARFQPPPDRFQFHSKDELAMVQSGPRMLAVNHLRPYPGWDVFVGQIRDAFETYIATCNWQPLQRIGLLYINRIDSGLKAEQILSVSPRTETLPGGVALSKFVQQWEMSFDHSTMTLTTTSVSDPAGYVVQLDASTASADNLKDLHTVADWLDKAHETVYQVFEKSLTPDTFERLKG